MSIFCLPVELIQSIAEETPAKDVACLRATCSLVNAAVEPVFFSEIVLNDHTCYPRPLQTLATSEAASQHARRLFISFSFRPEFAVDGLGMPVQSVRSHLGPAICSLKGLHTVRWKIAKNDHRGTRETIISSLLSLQNLRTLAIDTFSLPSRLWTQPIAKDTSLRQISLSTHLESNCFSKIADPIRDLIHHSPQLQSLHLVQKHHRSNGCEWFHFTELVEGCPPLTHLESLHLTGWKVQYNPSLAVDFHSLSALTISEAGDLAEFLEVLQTRRSDVVVKVGPSSGISLISWGAVPVTFLPTVTQCPKALAVSVCMPSCMQRLESNLKL